MSSVSVFVGLDYHQESVQVCVMDAAGKTWANCGCANDWERIQTVVHGAVARAKVAGPVKVFAAIEACCGAADLAEELIAKAGWSVDMAHAGYVARIKQSPDKTDFTDARLLADLERVGYLPKVWLPPAGLRDWRRLVRRRQQLAGDRRNVKLRIGALLRELRVEATGRRWTKAWLGWLKTCDAFPPQTRLVIDDLLEDLEDVERKIRRAESRIVDAMGNDPLVKKLMEMKGVGLVIAAALRVEIGRFDRFRNGKQLSRFCGLSPRNASSGQRQADAGVIKAGNPQLRAVLIQAAHLLKRHDPRWSRLAASMRARGKPGSVVTAAIANRWVRGLFHELKTLAA